VHHWPYVNSLIKALPHFTANWTVLMFQTVYYNDISTTVRRTDMKLTNLNCITNSCSWYTYVTWRDNEYELAEDEHDSVETCSGVMIYKLIVIVFLLVILQNNINARYMYWNNKFQCYYKVPQITISDYIEDWNLLFWVTFSLCDRLCGLVVRVPGYKIQRTRSRFPALPDFLSGGGSGRGPLSLVRSIEELLE
jgi:hypothetical protein